MPKFLWVCKQVHEVHTHHWATLWPKLDQPMIYIWSWLSFYTQEIHKRFIRAEIFKLNILLSRSNVWFKHAVKFWSSAFTYMWINKCVFLLFFFLHLIHSPTASPEISFFQLTFFGCFSVSKGMIWEERLLYAWQIVKPLKANNKDSVVPNKAVSATIVLLSMKSLGWNGFYAGSRHHSESRIKVTKILLLSPLTFGACHALWLREC